MHQSGVKSQLVKRGKNKYRNVSHHPKLMAINAAGVTSKGKKR